jgi:hypothetical protein
MKYSLKAIWSKVTPPEIKRWANAWFIACTLASGSSAAAQWPTVGLIIFITGFISKVLSEGFHDGS